MTNPSLERSARVRVALQLGYAALFAAFVLLPNLRVAPSLILVAGAVLTAIWFLGGLLALGKMPQAHELLLSGSAAPILVGLTQLAYRLNFLRTHGALTRHEVGTDSAAGFLAVWVAELLLILLPGILFLWWNARSLPPVDQRLL